MDEIPDGQIKFSCKHKNVHIPWSAVLSRFTITILLRISLCVVFINYALLIGLEQFVFEPNEH